MTLEIIFAPIVAFSLIAMLFLLVRLLPRERYSTFVAMAIGYAHCAHKDQRRKYTNTPYIEHCIEVMEICEEYGLSDEVLAAAVLHDTVEDTAVTVDDIARLFGPVTARLVDEVTDVSRPEDGNRAYRKAKDAIHLSQSSPDGANIKLVDTIANTASIVKHAPGFARIYLAEKFALLPLLSHGDTRLHARARDVLILARQQLDLPLRYQIPVAEAS